MKIAFVGNQDNNAYRICVWIRELAGDPHLYMIHQERGPRSHPELIDVCLAEGYPSWIRWYDDRGKAWFLKPSGLARRIEQEYDVVVTSGVTGLLAANQFRRVPVVHLTLGSEVNDFPLRLFRLRTTLPWRVVALLLRRALHRVKRVITIGFEPEVEALKRFGLEGKMRIWGFPEDIKGNRKRINKELQKELNRKYSKYERVFLWLSRLNHLDRSSPEYKGSEKFLEAFERTVHTDRRNVRAIIGTHGADVEAFQQLVRDKGLEPYVDYVLHLPYWKVLTYLSIENGVVFDELARGHGVIGGLSREALSVGAVLVKAIDRDLVSRYYGQGCPVMDAYDTQTCYDAMVSVLTKSEREFKQLKKAFADWAQRYLDYEKQMPKFINILQEAIYCSDEEVK